MLDVKPSQVGELFEFFWYAPWVNILVVTVLLWLAAVFALNKSLKEFNLTLPPLPLLAGAALAVGGLLGLCRWQKQITVDATRTGIATYMVRAGLRDISFDQIRQTINADYTNNLLLAVSQDNTTFRTSILHSLSLKLLDSTKLKEISHDEYEVADSLTVIARRLAGRYPKAVLSNQRMRFLFREIDEAIFPKQSQLLIVAALKDYPERFQVLPKQALTPDIVDVNLSPVDLTSKPIWFRKSQLVR